MRTTDTIQSFLLTLLNQNKNKKPKFRIKLGGESITQLRLYFIQLTHNPHPTPLLYACPLKESIIGQCSTLGAILF